MRNLSRSWPQCFMVFVLVCTVFVFLGEMPRIFAAPREETDKKPRPAAAPEAEKGFTPIFNGKDLTGWQGESSAKGLISLQLHPGPPMKVQFKNIRVKMD